MFIYQMTDSWNNAGTTFTAVQMNVTDTASQAASLLMDLQVGGVSKFSVNKGGVVNTLDVVSLGSNGFRFGNAGSAQLRQDGYFGFTATNNAANAVEVAIYRDAANTLAQRNGVNAQAFRVYNSYTDASNYERGTVQWNSNVFEVGSEAAGTGTARAIRLKAAGVNSLLLNTNAFDRWSVTGAGHFIAQLDNTYDIGASGANRPRNVYLAGALNANSIGSGISASGSVWANLGAATTTIASLRIASGVAPSAPNNGDIWFDGTNIKMQIGGVTKTFTLA